MVYIYKQQRGGSPQGMANEDADEGWTGRRLQHPGLIIKGGKGIPEQQKSCVCRVWFADCGYSRSMVIAEDGLGCWGKQIDVMVAVVNVNGDTHLRYQTVIGTSG